MFKNFFNNYQNLQKLQVMTVVEWLEKEFIKLESTIGVHGKMYELIEQAKQMETEQQQKMVDDALTNYELGWADRKASSQTEISEPNPQLIESMCYRYRHDFGILEDNEKESIKTTMKQLWEEVVGKGFYKPKEISDEEILNEAINRSFKYRDSALFENIWEEAIEWYREQRGI